MADQTKIEWADATVNAINGCSLASPGCTNCYAMKLAGTRMKTHPTRAGLTQESKAGPVWTGEVRLHWSALLDPLKWKRPRRIFWNAHGDLFHDAVPDEWIDRVFAVCALTPQHTHMILTKRSARMRAYMSSAAAWEHIARQMLDNYKAWGVSALPTLIDALANRANEAEPSIAAMPIRNVWLGVSVEDQTRADERIPDLLATPAAVRFISAEPLLGPVDLRWIAEPDDEKDGVIDALLGCNWIDGMGRGEEFRPVRPGHQDRVMHRWVCSPESDILANRKLDWVIVGGESGPGARPMHPDWARSLRDQCAAAGVPFHFKQWGNWTFTHGEENANGGVDFNPPVDLGINIMRWRKWEGDCAREPRKGESVAEWFTPAVYAIPVGKKAAGRLLDGVEHNGVPEVSHG